MFGTLNQVEKRWISMGEHRINVRIWKNLKPDAPTAVLMHGAVVSSLYMLPLAHELSRDFHIYVPELPGQGSSPLSHRSPDTLERGGILAALLERLDLRDVTLVASSYGSQVSVEALISDSSRVSSLLMIGPTVDDDRRGGLSLVARTLVGLPFEAWWFTPLAFFDLLRFGPLRVFKMVRDMARHDMLDRVSEIEVPTQIVRGDRDYLCPEGWANRLAEALQTDVVTVPNAGHTTHTRSPKAVGDEVRKLAKCTDEFAPVPVRDTFAS